MRRILSNHREVAHFWANEIQEEGYGSSMFFEDRTIYSYGYHFAIAKHYDNDLILLTNRSYSTSTSKHISYTKQAIPSDKRIIYCHSPHRPNNQANYDSAIDCIKYNLKKAINARIHTQRYLSVAKSAYSNLVMLKTIFGITEWKIPEYDFSISKK